jgi:hypothetical protein
MPREGQSRGDGPNIHNDQRINLCDDISASIMNTFDPHDEIPSVDLANLEQLYVIYCMNTFHRLYTKSYCS